MTPTKSRPARAEVNRRAQDAGHVLAWLRGFKIVDPATGAFNTTHEKTTAAARRVAAFLLSLDGRVKPRKEKSTPYTAGVKKARKRAK